jgi:hypothetical protein
MTQPSLIFSAAPEPMRPRLSRQCLAILERLQAGPATNAELVQLALKYTGRLSELRQAGYDVQVATHNRKTGQVVYVLIGWGR